MKGNTFDQTAFCKDIAALLRGHVSNMVFLNRPRSFDSALTDFVVVRIAGSIRDRCAYGECVFSFSLFARDIKNMKNGEKLSMMESALHTNLPYESGRIVFKPFSYNIVGDVPDDNGYHLRIVNVNAFVKPEIKTD